MTGEKEFKLFEKGYELGRKLYAPPKTKEDAESYNQARSFFMPGCFMDSFYLLAGGAHRVASDGHMNLEKNMKLLDRIFVSQEKRLEFASELEIIAIADNFFHKPEEYIRTQVEIYVKKNQSDYEDMDTEAELKKVPVWNEELKKYFGEFHDGEFVFMMTANGLKFTKEDLKKAYEQNQRLPLFRWGLNSVLDLCLSDVLDEKGKSIGIQLFPNAAEYLKKYVIIEQNKMPGEQTQHKQNQQVSYWIGLANAFQEQ